MSYSGKHNVGEDRAPIERMVRIARLLRAGLPFNLRELAREMEIHERTLHRDLAFMRDRLGYEVEYDAPRWKYVLVKGPTPVL